MAPLTSFTTVSSVLLGLVSAQSTTVTQIFFPFADPQPLDASIIAQVSQMNASNLGLQIAVSPSVWMRER